MNTVMLAIPGNATDAELVELCRAGDREAFSLIVERYQGLLCGLAYSCCGDFPQSEDLAQETFLIAWRKLDELESPEKLKAWLCSILRNLARNALRGNARDPLAGSTSLEEELAAPGQEPGPPDHLMSHEELALMWRLVKGMPAIYREPLVLFYRLGNSSAQVAEALELSEETARQRLARGRALLGERAAGLLGSGLRQTGPSKAFVVAVLAALPAAAVSTATAATGAASTAAVASGAKVPATGFLVKLGSAATLLSTGASFLGLWGHILNTRSKAERRFIGWASGLLVVWAVGWTIVLTQAAFYWQRNAPGEWSRAIILSLCWLMFSALLDTVAIWMAVRQARIRARDQDHRDLPLDSARRGYRLSICGSMLAVSLASTGWLMWRAARAGDVAWLAILVVVVLLATVGAVAFALLRPASRATAYKALLWTMTATVLLSVGLRWENWQPASVLGLDTSGPILLLVAVVFGSVRAGWWLKQRLLATRTMGRDVFAAAAGFTLLMGCGWLLLRSAAAHEPLRVESIQALLVDVRADAPASFHCLTWSPNVGSEPMKETRFVSNEPPIQELRDARGRVLALEIKRDQGRVRYRAPLFEPVPPQHDFFSRSEGKLPGIPRQVVPGLFQISQRHWPANQLHTLRVERYRLPPGARLIRSDFAALESHRLPDGRWEIYARKLIPPGGNIRFEIDFQVP